MKNNNATPGHPTVKREGWVVVLASSLTIMGSVMVAPILPKLAAEFGPIDPEADVLVPIAITGPALAIALFAPLSGWLADRFGRKNLLVLATLLYAVLGAIPALLNDLSGIVTARFMFGCAEAAIMTCCAALIADYWAGEDRLKLINYQVVTIGIVGSIFFVIGGALGEHSWRTPFYLYLLPLLLVPFMLKLLWEPMKQDEAEVASGPNQVGMATVVIGYLLVMFGMILNFIVPVQTPTLLVSMGETSSTMIGMSTGLGLLATLGGAIFWPWIRRMLGIQGCNMLLFLLLAIGLWFLSKAQTYNEVLFAVCIHGLGAGLLVPNAMAPVMNALSSETRGRGMGGFTSSLYFGQFVSPLVIAAVATQVPDLRSAIYAMALASLVASGIWLLSALRSRMSSVSKPDTPTA